MCLGVPGRILDISGDGVTRSGRVDFGGIVKDVSLTLVPEARADDYVIVHVGFAIARLDEAEAARVLDYVATMGTLKDLEGKTE